MKSNRELCEHANIIRAIYTTTFMFLMEINNVQLEYKIRFLLVTKFEDLMKYFRDIGSLMYVG